MHKKIILSLIIPVIFVSCLFPPSCFAEVFSSEYVRIPFAQKITLEANIYRPDDSEQHPLIIFNHGRPGATRIKENTPAEFYPIPVSWFVDRGFVVVVPLRRAYGKSDGADMETSNPFNPYRVGMAGADDIKAVIAFMKNKPYADSKRIVLAGLSCGGLVSIAAASQGIDGVIGVLNFSGGLRYDSRTYDGAETLFSDYKTFGTNAKIPGLWVYSANDTLFPAYFRDGMFKAFTKAGGNAKLVVLSDNVGHSFIKSRATIPLWEPHEINFLTSLNLPITQQQ